MQKLEKYIGMVERAKITITLGTALITGGAKRIGRVIALTLADAGYNIALNYNNSKSDAEELKSEIENIGSECEIFKADISNIKECKKLFSNVYTKFPDLNILINNASIFERMKFEDTNEEFLDENFAIHFKAPFFLSQEFAKFVKSGNIINITDSNTRRNSVEFFGYMLSKKSLNELTKMSARILAPKVRVNAIAPGRILASPDMTEEQLKERAELTPLKATATAEDISKTILQILDNTAITGHIFYLDGGEHLI